MIYSNSLTIPQGPALQFLYSPHPPNLVLFATPSGTSTPQKLSNQGFPGGSAVKNPPANWAQVGSLVWEDPTC